jgi:hypothetical protein
MATATKEIKEVSTKLVRSLRTINEAHLAHFSRKRVPEIALVTHVRKALRNILKSDDVFPTVKGLHEKHSGIVFLMQPDVDLSFRYNGRIHAVEFKLMRRQLSFYGGLEEALACSTYGVDYSWIVHFFRRGFENREQYKRWMEFLIKKSKCPSVGYIASDTKFTEVIIFPRQPFRAGDDGRLQNVVVKMKNKIFKMRAHSA